MPAVSSNSAYSVTSASQKLPESGAVSDSSKGFLRSIETIYWKPDSTPQARYVRVYFQTPKGCDDFFNVKISELGECCLEKDWCNSVNIKKDGNFDKEYVLNKLKNIFGQSVVEGALDRSVHGGCYFHNRHVEHKKD